MDFNSQQPPAFQSEIFPPAWRFVSSSNVYMYLESAPRGGNRMPFVSDSIRSVVGKSACKVAALLFHHFIQSSS